MKWVCLFALLLTTLSLGFAGYQWTVVPQDQVEHWRVQFNERLERNARFGSGTTEGAAVVGDEAPPVREMQVVGGGTDAVDAEEPRGSFAQKQTYDIDIDTQEGIDDTQRKKQGLDDAKKKVKAIYRN